MSTLVVLIIGVVIGTFIPAPQQTVVKEYAMSAWTYIKSLFNSTNSEGK
jgi:hypothetical protein